MDWNLDAIVFLERHGLRTDEPSKHDYFIKLLNYY